MTEVLSNPDALTVLLLTAVRDDREAFAQLHTALDPVIRGFLAARTVRLDAADLDDVVQEVFTRLWTVRTRFEARSTALTFTFTLAIAKNVLRERIAASRVANVHPVADPNALADPVPVPLSTFDAATIRAAVRKAKKQLTPEQRTAFHLVHILDLPRREAAETAGGTREQLRSRLYRARRRLRQILSSSLFDRDSSCIHTERDTSARPGGRA